MKKSICFYFQVHQPDRLRLYRFFDIGKDSHYYDDFTNRTILRRVASRCYLPMNALLLDLIQKTGGAFKVTFSISGSTLEQFDRYTPEVVESFRKLAATGSVEFLAETYYHSLVSLNDPDTFRFQVNKHKRTIEEHFGRTPTTFRNTELIYSDDIGEMVAALGFRTMLTEGAKHILGWRSPNLLYTCAKDSRLKLLLKNSGLSDDIAFRFSDRGWENWPLTAEKYLAWLKTAVGGEDIINLFMDYETFGEHQKAQSGIFEFMRHLPDIVLEDGTFEFVTPAQASEKHEPVAELDVPDAISWADEERDLSAWLGNELQNEAISKLYSLTENLITVNNEDLWSDFGRLQQSDHFYYMCTKFFSDGAVHKYFNPYDTPYEAFINYMNVLSDFILRVDDAISVSGANFADQKPEMKVGQTVRRTSPKSHDKPTASDDDVSKLPISKMSILRAQVKTDEKRAKAEKKASKKPVTGKKAAPTKTKKK